MKGIEPRLTNMEVYCKQGHHPAFGSYSKQIKYLKWILQLFGEDVPEYAFIKKFSLNTPVWEIVEYVNSLLPSMYFDATPELELRIDQNFSDIPEAIIYSKKFDGNTLYFAPLSFLPVLKEMREYALHNIIWQAIKMLCQNKHVPIWTDIELDAMRGWYYDNMDNDTDVCISHRYEDFLFEAKLHDKYQPEYANDLYNGRSYFNINELYNGLKPKNVLEEKVKIFLKYAIEVINLKTDIHKLDTLGINQFNNSLSQDEVEDLRDNGEEPLSLVDMIGFTWFGANDFVSNYVQYINDCFGERGVAICSVSEDIDVKNPQLCLDMAINEFKIEIEEALDSIARMINSCSDIYDTVMYMRNHNRGVQLKLQIYERL